jgi:hypothetical protein
VLHADATGWRVDGKTCWLWWFTTSDLTSSMIDRSRGSAALKKVFKNAFAGVWVTDYWSADNAVVGVRKQNCPTCGATSSAPNTTTSRTAIGRRSRSN